MTIHSSTRPTYPQDWPAYNLGQTSEKDTLMTLLADLCAGISQPEYSFGRPRLPLADMVYTGALKVYTGFSARRFDSDVREAHRRGFIGVTPAFNMVNRYIANPGLRSVITDLIERSAEPLSVVESYFAADRHRLLHLPFRPLVRSQVGQGEVAAPLAQGPYRVRNPDEHRHQRRDNPEQRP